jgi:hypothetical protein
MAAAKTPHKNWQLSHDPMARPLGCNGRYGPSGRVAHNRRGEEVCFACRESHNHYRREAKRGNPGTGRRLKPCGTNAAAKRHRAKGEPVCFKCRVAETNYNTSRRKTPAKRS